MRVPPIIVVFAVAGAIIGAQQLSRAPSSKQDTFTVYRSVDDCVSRQGEQDVDACKTLADQAQLLAETMTWPFADQQECESSYGPENCQAAADGSWQVKMAAFTQFSKHTSFGSALPVLRSSTHPGLYLPNGYPVLAGDNTVMEDLLKGGAYLASQPRSLNDDLCIKRAEAVECAPLHSLVSNRVLDLPVVAALFSKGR